MKERCPTCGHAITNGGRLTSRELDVLTAWWLCGTVRAAAHKVGVGEQRAKNLLSRARIRNQVQTNDDLLEMHFVAARTRAAEWVSQNYNGHAVA